jgi:SAM-dependent methyltransferase
VIKQIVDFFLDRFSKGNNLNISNDKVESLGKKCGVEAWHIFAVNNRRERHHVTIPCRWLKSVLPTSAAIFEPGCGSGANLLWLAKYGYYRLYGADLLPEALEFARELAQYLRIPLDLRQDDGMNPLHLPKDMDAILSVNWLYHLKGADLGSFLSIYSPCLKNGGYIAFDLPTTRYNHVKNNKYHTHDWKLPVKNRRSSEYTIRLDRSEIKQIAAENGFLLVKDTCIYFSNPQRAVYLIKKF